MWMIVLDLWDKRVGVAHTTLTFCFPRAIVPRVEIFSYLKKLQKEYSFEIIIVGLPYDLYGKDTKQLEKTQKFIEKLKFFFPEKEIIGYDERFTSFEARIGKEKEKYIDDISASLIGESYLRSHPLA
jgi:putative transcription antitermination factor YqgF